MEIPNSMTMVALQRDGTPAKNARVRIVTESKWMAYVKSGTSLVLDSMLTDQRGQFTVRVPDKEHVRIEIISRGEGISISLDSSRTTASLEPLGSLQAQWIPGATVMIAGTSFSQKVDQNGVVFFASIPKVNSVLIGVEQDQKPVVLSSILLNPYDSLRLGKLEAQRDSLVLDDFERNSSATLLSPSVHGSYWFSIADEQEGGGSTIYPSTANGNAWSLAITDSSAWSGKSITIHYHIDSSSNKGAFYAVMGCTLGNGINGNAIDSIVFMAYSDARFSLTNGYRSLLQGASTSSTGWSRFAIHRSDLDSLGVSSKMELLQFAFSDTDGSVFRLDDFVLYGDPFELLQVE